MPPTLKVNRGISKVLGNVSGSAMGAASAYDAALSSDMVRFGVMGGAGLVGLWGASDPGGMGGLQGFTGMAGIGAAGFAAGGAWSNSAGGLAFRNKHMQTGKGGAWGGFNRHFTHGFNNAYGGTSNAMGTIGGYASGYASQAEGYVDIAKGYASGMKENIDTVMAGL